MNHLFGAVVHYRHEQKIFTHCQGFFFFRSVHYEPHPGSENTYCTRRTKSVIPWRKFVGAKKKSLLDRAAGRKFSLVLSLTNKHVLLAGFNAHLLAEKEKDINEKERSLAPR